MTVSRKGGAPTSAQRREKRIRDALTKFRETMPKILDRLVDVVANPATPAAILPQLVQAITKMTDFLPDPVTLERELLLQDVLLVREEVLAIRSREAVEREAALAAKLRALTKVETVLARVLRELESGAPESAPAAVAAPTAVGDRGPTPAPDTSAAIVERAIRYANPDPSYGLSDSEIAANAHGPGGPRRGLPDWEKRF